jgi:hypothetical protein
MRDAERIAFTASDASLGDAGLRPVLSIELRYQQESLVTSGLLDTGATVNVLPYSLGEQLGAVWEEQTVHWARSGKNRRFPFA